MKRFVSIKILVGLAVTALLGLPLSAFFSQPALASDGSGGLVLPGYEDQPLIYTPETDSSSDDPAGQKVSSSESGRVEGSGLTAVSVNPGYGFVHVAAEEGTPIVTIMNAPALNNKPFQKFIATLVKDPGRITTPDHNHPIGAYYWDTTGQWAIFNEDLADMSTGQVFNIFVPPVSATAFTHISTVDNVVADATRIDHFAFNGDPNAFVFVLPVNNPGGVTVGTGIYDHPVGVFYRNDHWWIYNEDYQNFTAQAAFFVYKADLANDVVYMHKTNTDNVDANKTYLDHPALNGNPNALVYVQHRKTDLSLNDTVGVWYDPAAKRWVIYKTSGGTMESNQWFQVLVIPNQEEMFVYEATTDRIVPGDLYSLRIDHPLLNGNPNAQIQVTHNLTPGGVTNLVFDNNPISLRYYYGYWHIYHANYSPIQEGAYYNVYINYSQINAYATQANSYNTSLTTLTLNHPYLNSQPDAIFIQTQNLSPAEGVGAAPYDYTTAADYASGEWSIRRSAGPDIPMGASFNVLIPDRNRFIHTSDTSDIENMPADFITCIDHPLTNNRPGAILFVTANNMPNDSPASNEDSNLGIYYHPDLKKWCIFTEDGSNIASNTAFNIFTEDVKVFLPLITR